MLSGNRQTRERYRRYIQEEMIFLANVLHYSNILIEQLTDSCLNQPAYFSKEVLTWLR